MTPKEIHSAWYLVWALLGSIFVGETLIMLFIDMMPPLSKWSTAFLDAALLLALSFPAIFFLAFQPLKKHIIRHEQTEVELFASNSKLREHEKQLEVKNFELKRANLALKESNDRFAHLFDFSPSGYLVLGEDCVISEINLTGAMLLGADKDKLVNSHFLAFLPAEEHDHWQEHMKLILARHDKQSCKLIMQRLDGSVFYALLDCRRDDSLISSNIRVSFTDITKQNWTSL